LLKPSAWVLVGGPSKTPVLGFEVEVVLAGLLQITQIE
jgi:hypothetical protein